MLGTSDFDGDLSGISIYPNPASNFLNIGLKNSNVVQTVIYSMNGAKVMEIEDAGYYGSNRAS